MGYCLLNTCSRVGSIKIRSVELHIQFQDMFEEELKKINYKIHHLEMRTSKIETCLEVRNLKHRGKKLSKL